MYCVDNGIKQRLIKLYGNKKGEKAMISLTRLIIYYKARIKSTPYIMNENDAILITYGDQVASPGEPPLCMLKNFLNHYLKESINSVHILPFFPYSSDDGFSVIDYKEVSPRMGSWREIEEIGKNFHLMFDGVINHISQYSHWFKGYLSDEPEYKDFFIDIDPSIDLSLVTRPRATPLLNEYKDEDGRIRHIWSTFSKDQVDLNYANYKVLLAVLDALLYYVKKGATLIRLDAIAFVWKEIGTTCVHLPQTHEVIQLLREVIHEVAPEIIIVTETNVPHDENISYFGSGENEAQMVYNFALPPLIAHAILSSNAHYITTWAKSLTLPNDKVCFFNFTASHDGIGMRPARGILPQCELDFLQTTCIDHGGEVSYRKMPDGQKEPYELNCTYIDLLSHPKEENTLRVKRFLLSQAIMLSMPGVPGIYFHSLIGATNDHEGVKRTGMFRSINREKFNIGLLDKLINNEGNKEHIIFKSYQSMLSIRTKQKAFNPFSKFEILDMNVNVFAIVRYGEKNINNILALHNCSDEEVQLKLPKEFEKSKELITGRDIKNYKITLLPYQFAWLKQVSSQEIK